MTSRKWLFANLLMISIGATSTTNAESAIPGFSGGEHAFAGDKIKLYVDAADKQGKSGKLLTLPNQMQLSYGDLMTLADFYGTPERPISEGKNDAEKRQLFLDAFNSFAQNSLSGDETKMRKEELAKLLAVVHMEEKTVTDGIKNGEKPEAIYRRISGNINRQYNCITGGGCDGKWWLKQGRYLQLANSDVDHYGANAILAYQIGHQLAIEQAIQAHAQNDVNQLSYAYAMNGFACHFLSDIFASGHMRIPRAQLRNNIKTATVGSLLAHYMHEEENSLGLHVRNAIGNTWIAYGDKHYFNYENSINREVLHEALQESANLVFAAYLTGVKPVNDKVISMIPQPIQTNDMQGPDIAPLFYWDENNQTLYRRSVMTNVNDYHWTSDWWGWSTLVELTAERGLPTDSQASLVASGYGKQALAYGIISDKNVIMEIK